MPPTSSPATPWAADLRRAMGKKKKEIMDEERGKFVAGLRPDNPDPRPLRADFRQHRRVCGYGFNQAPSVGYGLISYQTAFMKANYPPNSWRRRSPRNGNSDKLPGFVVEPPTWHADSAARCQPQLAPLHARGDGVRFGLAGIRRGRRGAEGSCASARRTERSGTARFFAAGRRQFVNKRVLEALGSAAVAMDGFGSTGALRSHSTSRWYGRGTQRERTERPQTFGRSMSPRRRKRRR